MKKSTLIAAFLVNLNAGIDLQGAEHIVRQTFASAHAGKSFETWNSELPDEYCNRLIAGEPSPSRVNVEQFILDLWD